MIKNLRLSNLNKRLIFHGILQAQVNKLIFKFGTLTVVGGNFSNMMVKTLEMSKTIKFLMSKEEKMPKVKVFRYGTDTMDLIKNGNLFILMKLQKKLIKDLIKTLGSILIDHSSLCQKCLWEE